MTAAECVCGEANRTASQHTHAENQVQVPDTNYSVSVKDSVTLSLNQIQSVGCAVCQSICIFSEVLKGITELHLVQQHGVYVVTSIITKSPKNLLELMSKPELKINAQT